MIELIISIILIISVTMSGLRRIRLLNKGFAVQSFFISIVCLIKGYELNEFHYFILFLLTLIVKAIIIPYIINRAIRDLKINREIEFSINVYWSYILTGISVGLTFALLIGNTNLFLKSGISLVVVGIILLVGRKKAITQMIGLLTMENGIVLFEISMVKMGVLIEFGIIFEMLILALIMGIMIFRINKTFDSINTDHLSNLKE